MNYIGFTEKYYTLWNVTTEGKYTYYQYVQNLSMDFDKAKAKQPTALIDLSLRGHRSFKVENKIANNCFLFGKYREQLIADHKDDKEYIKWYYNHLDNDALKTPINALIQEIGYVLHNGKAYTENELEERIKLEQYFPMFENKLKNHESFQFNAKKNLKVTFDEFDVEIGVINIPFCNIFFNDIEKKEYNGYEYAVPTLKGRGYNIKGKRVVIDEYLASFVEDMTYDIVPTKWHIA